MEITLSIVGSAGRGDDAKRMSKNHFEAAYIVAEGLIDQFGENNYPITHLVSGGAAFIDHVAVRLFLKKKVKHLRLFLPCQWDNGSYEDSGTDDFKTNPGRTLNKYHKAFQNRTLIHSLSEIQSAKFEGAELLPCRGGFYGRNAMVAKSDCLIAMTFGNKEEVKDGGTAHTVKCYLERVRKGEIYDKSFHYDLGRGEVFQGCVVPKETPDEALLKKSKYGKLKLPGMSNSSNIIAVHSYPP